MSLSLVLVVILTSLTSLPIAFYLNKTDAMKDQRLVFGAGMLSLLGATVLPALFMRRFFRNIDPLIYACACFSWSSVIDLFIGLELDGYVSGYMGFYFLEGEPYLKTAYGTMINYWDGTAHLALYLAIITLYCTGESYREVGLYWVGSIMNSMIVFLPGNVAGKFGIKWSYLLNVPYLIIPMVAGFKFIKERPLFVRSYLRIPSLLERPVDLLFAVFFMLCSMVAVFRGMAVLGAKSDMMHTYLSDVEPYLNDPNIYPKMQMLVYLYYYLFYYLTAVYGLTCPAQSWMADMALIHAGAAAQAQFVHITSSLHHRTAECYHAAMEGSTGALFWGVNLALLIGPHLFAWQCVRRPDLFGETYTVNTAEPITVSSHRKRE
ncbi:transmembrane 6 superfamily member 1-like [Haliotis cracherodii]|uniref:transmembrane 6 superfamily member 1-like n=1 Tax=Haliotis cracherodii TaxID=6455 RepID=UPI0039ED6F6D